ncbi:hypothetical protein E8F12_02590 [Pseudomonas sp. BN102]|nr:hypothetical protein [Pseudomonas sp. BN102]
MIYRRTRNLRVVQLLLGHTKLESKARYLGIGLDNALKNGGSDRSLTICCDGRGRPAG